MDTLNRILVPVDLSRGSQAALEYASFLAERFDASLEVLHVFDPRTLDLMDTGAMPLELPGGEQTVAEFARSCTEKAVEDLLASAGLGKRPIRRRYLVGKVPRSILEEADQGEFDLVVMGTHGRTGLSRAFWGSVAENVMRHATCPVVTVKETNGASTEGKR